MLRRIIILAVCTWCLNAQDVQKSLEEGQKAPRRGLWKVSIAALAASQVLDIHSSWGYPEVNGVIRSPAGRFGAKAVGIKAAVSGLVVVGQWMAFRKSNRSARVFAVLNLTAAGATAGAAAWNYHRHGAASPGR